MGVLAGQQLLHYRVVEKIGEGGMGVVWKAVDTTLDREVAIKVLPDAFAAHSERLARFEREAKVLASLSHPNVAGIYGLHEAQGTRFLAMELVSGEELRLRIARGPLGIEQALAIALGIAEALEYAHERGIVHRDLKPANVKITASGAVKVLDFGLAKALDPSGADAPSATSLAHSPTVTLGATQAGVILGTAAYMSPEQAAGQVADRRADIWAFGVVLYEMLAGRRLFEGETVSHLLAAVLKDEPEWSALPADVPPRLRELLQRCLCKKARGRLQSIGDARVSLEEWVADPQTLAPRAEPVSRRAASRRGLGWIAVACGLAGFLLGAFVWRAARDSASGAPAVMRFPLILEEGQELALDDFPAVALSPDGRRQVIVTRGEDGTERLVLRDLNIMETRVLEGTENGCAPFFSPDGEWVAFFTQSNLQKVAVAGGTPVTLAAVSPTVRGATWGSDGTIYVADSTQGGLKRIPQGGGELTPLTELDEARAERTHRWPVALPGGRAVLFTSDTFESTEFYDDARIEAVSAATGARRVVVEQSSQAQYLMSGHLVFARGGSLYAVPFDPVSLETAGSPTLVLQGVATDVSTGAVHFALSQNGSILYVPGELSAGTQREPVWVGRDGKTVPTGLVPGRHNQVSLSPDDLRLALLSSVGTSADLWVWVADLERGTLSRLTFEGIASDPLWTPDGLRIAYAANPPGHGSHGTEILWKSADGGGEAEVLWSDDANLFPMGFSPDGKLLAVDRAPAAEAANIWILPLAGDRKPWPFIESRFDETMPEFSPDGDFVAYVSDESGRYEVYVRPFPAPAGRWQISTDGGLEPRWSADGQELYYRNDGNLLRVAIDTASGFRAGRPEKLFEGLEAGGNSHTYDVSRDGRFVHLRQVDRDVERSRVNLVLNWDADVRRMSRPPE